MALVNNIFSQKKANFYTNQKKINKILSNEKKLKLDDYKTYRLFFKRIKKMELNLSLF